MKMAGTNPIREIQTQTTNDIGTNANIPSQEKAVEPMPPTPRVPNKYTE